MKKYIIPETTIIHVNPSPLLTGSPKNNNNISVVVDESTSGGPTITVSTEDNSGAGSIIDDAKAWKGGFSAWEEDN